MALLVVGPAALIASTFDDTSPAIARALTSVGIVIGYLLGGALAGRAVPQSPLINGATAGVLAFVVIQGIALTIRLINNESINGLALVFNGLLAASIATVGATLAIRFMAPRLPAPPS